MGRKITRREKIQISEQNKDHGQQPKESRYAQKQRLKAMKNAESTIPMSQHLS